MNKPEISTFVMSAYREFSYAEQALNLGAKLFYRYGYLCGNADASECSSLNMFKVSQVKALPNYRLWLKYSDGTEGEVDLSYLVGKGVFSIWKNLDNFKKVYISSSD